MTIIGIHASHELYGPRQLLDDVKYAEAAGFQGGSCSDHFHPWTERQGESGYAWSWLGAALEATTAWSFGTVTAPGQRYHPAIIAQAAATLATMYPGRLWFAAASGEYLNEHVTGQPWPAKPERNARLKESVDVMRALWAGETVTHHGLLTVEDARLYSLPAEPPLVYGAAISLETAEWVGSWADGLITGAAPPEQLQKMVDAFHRGGGEGKPMAIQEILSYASDDITAKQNALRNWGNSAAEAQDLADFRMPADFDRKGAKATLEDVEGVVRCSADLQRHAAWLRQDIELGFGQLFLHNVGGDQHRFIDDFAAHVLPQLR
jgi:probable non-F420 flavinoid oxidoreductase